MTQSAKSRSSELRPGDVLRDGRYEISSCSGPPATRTSIWHRTGCLACPGCGRCLLQQQLDRAWRADGRAHGKHACSASWGIIRTLRMFSNTGKRAKRPSWPPVIYPAEASETASPDSQQSGIGTAGREHLAARDRNRAAGLYVHPRAPHLVPRSAAAQRAVR